MIINLDPRRISTPAGAANRPDSRRAQAAGAPPMPRRAHVNIIPSPESLATLIRSAVAALRSGNIWDRGTILNLLV